MPTSHPTLVLISGAPATGKTTLVQRLTPELPLTVIEKDAIKECLFDTIGEGGRDWSKDLGAASFALLRLVLRAHLRAEQSILVEAAFQPEYDRPWLDRLQQQYNFHVLELHCHTDDETALLRYTRRETSGERHSGHRSGMSLDDHVAELRCRFRTYGPLTSGDSLVRIDTTDFAAIDYPAIVAVVMNSLAKRPSK